MCHYEIIKMESIKSNFDLYPQLIEKEQNHTIIMFSIDNKQKTLNIAMFEPKETSSKVVQEYKASQVKNLSGEY